MQSNLVSRPDESPPRSRSGMMSLGEMGSLGTDIHTSMRYAKSDFESAASAEGSALETPHMIRDKVRQIGRGDRYLQPETNLTNHGTHRYAYPFIRQGLRRGHRPGYAAR